MWLYSLWTYSNYNNIMCYVSIEIRMFLLPSPPPTPIYHPVYRWLRTRWTTYFVHTHMRSFDRQRRIVVYNSDILFQKGRLQKNVGLKAPHKYRAQIYLCPHVLTAEVTLGNWNLFQSNSELKKYLTAIVIVIIWIELRSRWL